MSAISMTATKLTHNFAGPLQPKMHDECLGVTLGSKAWKLSIPLGIMPLGPMSQ